MLQTDRRTYADAGVNLDAADDMVDRIAPIVRRTYGPRVLGGHGGFAGAFRLDYDERLFARNFKQPVLIACTDGVGSKVLVAAAAGRLDTVGIDLVAMNVNDMLTVGAEPMFFLDYIAVHKLDPAQCTELVEGVAQGCEQAGCALLGGETAEMPDLYAPRHFDLAGFAVGVVERQRMLDGKQVRAGDDLIGLSSSGLHSNGYALARRVLLKESGLTLASNVRSLGETLGAAMLRPTRIYVRSVLDALHRYRGRPRITAMAHITGGGLPGNLPRMLPANCDAVIRRGSWPIPPIFAMLEHGGVDEDEMYRVFNMGIGFVLATRPSSTAAVIRSLEKSGEQAQVIGKIRAGRGRVEIR